MGELAKSLVWLNLWDIFVRNNMERDKKVKTNIIYASFTCSVPFFEKLFKNTGYKPGQAVQKYNRLLLEGLAYGDHNIINAVTEVPLNHHNYPYWFFRHIRERVNNVNYYYFSLINVHIFKDLLAIISTFFLCIGLYNSNDNNVIITDVLNAPVALGAWMAARILRINCVSIVTDIPSMAGSGKVYQHISDFVMERSNSYVFITEQMNRSVNKRRRPYIIMEGLVDISEKDAHINRGEKNNYFKRTILYTGAIEKKYGIDNLINGFLMAQTENCELHFYGQGSFSQDLIRISNENSSIKYFGTVMASEVVQKQKKATLLINPRPIEGEYTKYSFPSKNMEYMVSGTPVLTTKLPGMPSEYLDYVYILDDYSAIGIRDSLCRLLLKSDAELENMGKKARRFVLDEKNNIVQALRVQEIFV